MTGSPLYAAVCRRLADDPVVAEIAQDDRGDLPLRLLGALHHLALSEGIDPWSDPARVVSEHAGWIAQFTAERVQTNEMQRWWALLPAFLSLGDRPLDLLELGPCAGLNLVWDRYLYRSGAGTWGPPDSELVLTGDERAPVPQSLLHRSASVVRRRGIDLAPVDATDDRAARLLECFVWADQIELAVWPERGPARVARMGYHGQWLEWLG